MKRMLHVVAVALAGLVPASFISACDPGSNVGQGGPEKGRSDFYKDGHETGSSYPYTTNSKPWPPVGQIADAYWNTWFTRDGAIIDTLEKNTVSTFSLDLSRYQYRLNKSVQVDAGLQKKLRETKTTKFYLFIRPILVGGALAFVNQTVSGHLMTVEIDRLRVKKDDTKESALFRDFRAGAIPLADFAKQTRASDEFEFKVLAKRDGCASIALSIWDESGQFPLDHLVHTVTVGAGPGEGKSCGNDRAHLQGGLATLLDAALDRGLAASKNIDVALHVFEFLVFREGQSKRTVAILVDRSRFQAAQPDASGPERGVYAWELQSTLSDYLGRPGQMLDAINKARDKAEKGTDDAYSVVSRELKLKLFSGADDDQTKSASAALAALQDTVNESTAPTMVIRMYSASYQPIYLPWDCSLRVHRIVCLPSRSRPFNHCRGSDTSAQKSASILGHSVFRRR